MATRQKKCDKVYVGREDNETVEKRSWFPGAERLELRFVNKETLTVELDDFDSTIQTAACYHGLGQKLGDTFAGKPDVNEAWETVQALHERLTDGHWVAERESIGPRKTLAVQAIVAAKTAAGHDVDADAVAKAYDALDDDARKELMEDVRVKAAYQKIMADRAAERAAKAAEAAEGAEDTGFAI